MRNISAYKNYSKNRFRRFELFIEFRFIVLARNQRVAGKVISQKINQLPVLLVKAVEPWAPQHCLLPA